MAQAGYTPISLYHSTTPFAAPLAANLVAGELAINIADGLLYYKNNSGVVTAVNSVSGVSTFSTGTTGLTPSSPTAGVVTLAGTLATTNGGTGLTSFTANRVFYASSTSAIGSSANLTFDGNMLTVNSVKVGRGGSGSGHESNTAVGRFSLSSVTTGTGNTSLGNACLSNMSTGTANTAVGNSALANSVGANNNTAVGYAALNVNSTGTQNTAIGSGALQVNATGSYNTAIGAPVLSANINGSFNVGIGQSALNTNIAGSNNVAVGVQSLLASTGTNNTSVGYTSLGSNTSGNTNTAIGSSAGSNNTTGDNNTFIGYNATGASAATSNNITLGDAAITTLRCQVTTITALSDERDKTNIKDIPAGLNFIEELRPVSFDWNTRDGAKVGIPEFGFIAQELQKAQKNTGIKVPNLVSEENPDKLEAGIGALLPILVKAIQELNEKVKILESKGCN